MLSGSAQTRSNPLAARSRAVGRTGKDRERGASDGSDRFVTIVMLLGRVCRTSSGP